MWNGRINEVKRDLLAGFGVVDWRHNSFHVSD